MTATEHRPECGTYAGFAAHRARLEQPCLDCRKAGREQLLSANLAPLSGALARMARAAKVDVPELRGETLDPPRRRGSR